MASTRKQGTIYRAIIAYIVLFCSYWISPPSHLAFAYSDIKTLDNYWNNRQSVEGQEIIIKFLSAAESIPQDFDISWRVARMVYFVGNFGVGYETLTKDKKILIFKYGYEAADIARTIRPDRVEGHYWYGTNLGSFGMAYGIIKALSYAEDGRDALVKAVAIDPTYHWGGPYRTLGRFYQAAPRFISFGDKEKAEECFNKALEIAPDFRLNTVNLAVLKKDLGNYKAAFELLMQAKKKPKVDGNVEENRYLIELDKGIQKLKFEANES